MTQANTLIQKRYPIKKVSRNKWTIFIVVFISIVLLILSGFFIINLYNNDSKKSDHNNDIINKISEITQLPNEEPTISTISDVESLKKDNPAFYKDAQNGDKVIIYTTKVYIYRPSNEKIINLTNITIDNITDTSN